MKMKNSNNLGLLQTKNLCFISFLVFYFGLNTKWPTSFFLNFIIGRRLTSSPFSAMKEVKFDENEELQ